MARICMIGAGYVGLVTGAGLAEIGHDVVCLETDGRRLAALRRHQLPIHEHGLDELVTRHVARGRLVFTDSYAEAIPDAEFVFIAVNTPTGANGEADTTHVFSAVRAALAYARPRQVFVTKSTVPVGTGDALSLIIRDAGLRGVEVVSNPEFLREGTAVQDFLSPDRIVIGADAWAVASRVGRLYSGLAAPVLICGRRSAELAKYAANALLAARISFINEMSAICESVDADIEQVSRIVGYDRRIGRSYLTAGLGWGGSCFPKDLRALAAIAAQHGVEPAMLNATVEVNARQRERMCRRLCEAVGPANGTVPTVAVLGLAFKPNTDDVRESPALDIIQRLVNRNMRVRAHDPVAIENARAIMPDIAYCADPYEAVANSDGMFLATEWDEYRLLDWAVIRELMKGRIIVDSRNALDGGHLRELGFRYLSVGRRAHAERRFDEEATPLEYLAAGGL